MGRRGKRSKQLLEELKGTRRQWKLKEEALDRSVWRIGFGRGCVPSFRQHLVIFYGHFGVVFKLYCGRGAE